MWKVKDRGHQVWHGILEAEDLRSNIGTIQHIPVNEKDTVNKEYVDSVSGRQAVDLFLTADGSGDVGGYFNLVVDVDTSAEQTIAQTITANSTTLIASFASILDEEEIDNITLLESGVYGLHLHALAAVAKGMRLYFEFYKRVVAGGTETLLGTSHDTGILSTIEEQYEVHASITNDTAFESGDRIVIKVYGRNDTAANRSITIHMEGDTASRVEFPGFISPGNYVLRAGDTMTGTLFLDTIGTGLDVMHSATIGNFLSVGNDLTVNGTIINTDFTTLTDNSMADTLHRHSELSASDGDPDKAVYLDADGQMILTEGQINFPDAPNPSADTNTLDDYEEGTWTLDLTFGGNKVGITYTTNAGFYTKTGRIVTVTGYLILTSKGSSSGGASIAGLPFTSLNSPGNYSPPSLWLFGVSFADVPHGYVAINSAAVNLREINNAGTDTALTNGNFANTSRVMFSATYIAA